MGRQSRIVQSGMCRGHSNARDLSCFLLVNMRVSCELRARGPASSTGPGAATCVSSFAGRARCAPLHIL
eukprot:2241782-Prymnesium_polylepis.1